MRRLDFSAVISSMRISNRLLQQSTFCISHRAEYTLFANQCYVYLEVPIVLLLHYIKYQLQMPKLDHSYIHRRIQSIFLEFEFSQMDFSQNISCVLYL